MALLTLQKPAAPATALTYAAASGGGDTFKNTGAVALHVKNGGVGSITVTVSAPSPCSFGVVNVVHASVTVIPAGEDRLIGPFPTDQHNNMSGVATATYTGVTTVTVALVHA